MAIAMINWWTPKSICGHNSRWTSSWIAIASLLREWRALIDMDLNINCCSGPCNRLSGNNGTKPFRRDAHFSLFSVQVHFIPFNARETQGWPLRNKLGVPTLGIWTKDGRMDKADVEIQWILPVTAGNKPANQENRFGKDYSVGLGNIRVSPTIIRSPTASPEILHHTVWRTYMQVCIGLNSFRPMCE